MTDRSEFNASSGETIEMRPESLRVVAVGMQQGAVAIEPVVTERGRRIAPRVCAWSGTARVSLEELWAQRNSGAAKLHAALISIAAPLTKAGLAQAERSIAAAFQL